MKDPTFGLRGEMIRVHVVKRMVRATGRNIEDLLTSKKVWMAVFGLLIAVNQWKGWEVPTEVFASAELLILGLILSWKE